MHTAFNKINLTGTNISSLRDFNINPDSDKTKVTLTKQIN